MNQEDFPLIKNQKLIYFDSAATSLKPVSVLKAITNFYNYYGFNSHNHDSNLSYLLNQKIKETRKKVQHFINAKKSKEIIFTPSATYGLNQIAFGLQEFVNENDQILLTKLEHSSNILPWIELCKAKRLTIDYLPLTKEYLINQKKLLKQITKKTKIITFCNVSNTFGYLEDVKTIIQKVRKINKDIIFVIDGTQSVSCHLIDVVDLDVDFFVFSGHKMLASTGIGILYGQEKWLLKIKPLITGGGMWIYSPNHELFAYQYKKLPAKFEAGSLNSAGIFSLNAAITYLNSLTMPRIQEYVFNLQQYCLQQLKTHLNKRIVIYNQDQKSSLILFNFKNHPSHDVASWLANKHRILIRGGRLCTKYELDLLHTDGLLRISFYFYNTKTEIDYFINVLKNETNFIL